MTALTWAPSGAVAAAPGKPEGVADQGDSRWWASRQRRPVAAGAGPAAEAEALIRALYAEHGGLLLGYATRLTGDRQHAEDVVQETFVRAWRHADSLDDERGSVRAWLFTVARNLVTDRARARGARPREVFVEPAERTEARDHAEEVANAILIAEALRSLSPEHRDVLVEVYFRGRTATEAGQALGVPPGTVKSRVHYALQALRSNLGASMDLGR